MNIMDLENPPSLPHAHQQIRLGDIQASAHKWLTAIEYYLRAIEYFQAIQNTVHDNSLIAIIQAQIIQCEKTINLCRLKDRSEQAAKAECLSKMTRAYSTSNLKSSTKSNRAMSRHNTIQLENHITLGDHNGGDSLAAFIFSNNNKNNNTQISPTRTGVMAKKNKKDDSHKIEELQMGYEALKTHLKAAFDDIDRLKDENNQLRLRQQGNITAEQSELSSTDEDDPETELEATL